MAPLLPAKQETCEVVLALPARAAAGCVTDADLTAVQPFASVIVTVYVPDERLVKF